MSKNLTRKGLALGAVVALGSSLFAGAPAFANAALQVAPATGTGYTVLSSDTFAIKVVGNSSYTLNADSNLFWKITKPTSTSSVTYTLPAGGTTTPAAYSTSTVDFIDATARTVAAGMTSITLDPSLTTSTSADYIVQAYIESGLTNGLDANDTVVAPAVTVKFVRGADLLPAVTLDPVSAGLNITGTVKFSSSDFNYAQSTVANTDVEYNVNGGAFSTSNFATTLNLAEDAFEFDVTPTSAITSSQIVGVRAEALPFDGASTLVESAIVYSSASAASNALGGDVTVARGDNMLLTASSGLTGDYAVRTGTKSFSYRVDFYKEAGLVNLVAAGQPVRITVAEKSSSIVTNDVIRVNGKALTGASGTTQTAVLNTVTDATGGITVSVESTNALVGDSIEITVLAVGSTGTIQAQNDFTWTDAALTTFTATGTQLGADRLTLVRGSAVTLNYAIRDQFGKPWTKADTNYRVKAVAGGSSSPTLVLDTTAAFANGLATLTFTDNSTAAHATTTVVADLQEQTTPSGAFASATSGSTGTDITTNLNIVTAAQAAATLNMNAAINGGSTFSSATGTASSTLVPLADKTLAAIDKRSNTNAASIGNNTANAAKISGTVLNANGSNAAGVPVVIASAGRWFSTDEAGTTYVSKDSITVNTNVNGTYEVWALSQRGGAAAITITSGSVSKTQNLKWAAAAATSATTIAITAPDTSVAGRSVDVVVLLTDKHGAPVQTTTNGVERLSVAITGPGSNTAVAATTDEDGKISFKLIFGSNDNGTASVRVTYDADGAATVYAPVVVTKNILVGTAAAPVSQARIVGSTNRFFVGVDGNSSARNVVVKVAGRTFATLKGSATNRSYAVRAPKGSHKVTVFVGGKLIGTRTIVVR